MALLKKIENNRINSSDPISILSQLTDSQKQAKNVMSDLSQLSQSFVDSFQNIEVKVEELSGQLNDAETRHIIEKNEKIKLQSENDKINNRLNNLLDILPSGVVLIDHKGFVCDCNRVAIEILARPLLGETWVKVIERAFAPQADDGHQISLKETTSLSPEPGQMIVLTNLTQTRLLQDKLSQQNNLSSMGKMIASLAHQIRTPLSAAMIYGSHISESDLEKSQVKVFSENLMERLKFMDRQIHDMLQFVRGGRKQKQKISIKQLMSELKNSNAINDRINWHDVTDVLVPTSIFNEKVKKSEPLIEYYLLGSSDDLIGAISNLIENALAASNQDQTVNIKSSISSPNNPYNTNNNDNLVNLVIEVSDKGIGMVESQKQKIFEPFYTTKNNGNGLGLAIVNGVVIEHGGNIDLQSSVGNGSKFTIKLPIFKKELSVNVFSKELTGEVAVND
jgi:two-component system sensor histidine kinase FlrB